MNWSIRAQIACFWLFTAVVCVALGGLVIGMYRQGAGAQLEAARGRAVETCSAMQHAFGANVGKIPARDYDALIPVLDVVLGRESGIEGGVWDAQAGFVAYAFPTYEGSSAKHDVPPSEMARISEMSRTALATGQIQVKVQKGNREGLVVAACPLAGTAGRAAWTMTRVAAAVGAAYSRMAYGLAALLGFVLVSGIWLGRILFQWSQRLRGFEQSLRAISLQRPAALAPTGERDLDSIVTSVNALIARVHEEKNQSEAMAKTLAQSERLAALGRLSAGFAHEIRNPLAAMRLKAENALALPEKRQAGALDAILVQIDRLENFIGTMLVATQPFELHPREEAVRPWLEDRVEHLKARADRKGVQLMTDVSATHWTFDPIHLGRALDNLVVNAIEHSSSGDRIEVSASQSESALRLRVRDSGSGIPKNLRDNLFEPFVTGRPGGTGLGLSLTKEVAEAHRGCVRLVQTERGSCFELEIPWHAS